MSNAIAMRAYLRDTIGLADPAERRKAVREGLETIEDFVEFDEDGIKILCLSVRKPGDTILNPENANNTIPNSGYLIPAICKKRLKWAAYGTRIYGITNRTITPDSLSRARL